MSVKAQPRIPKIGVEEFKSASDSLWQRAFRRIRQDRLTMVSLAIIALLGALAIFAPFLTQSVFHVDPNRTNSETRFLPIGSAGHPLGTDDLGRDHLARLLYAGQISLSIGFNGAFLILIIGLVLGIITGYFGGAVDDTMNWIITTLDSIPTLYLLLIISAILSPSAEALILVLALVGWTGTTRLIRGETLGIREREYILSARAIGASSWRIMFIHILPNLMSITAISLATSIGNLILIESALSFLNVGVQPPTPTWGNMLTNSQTFFTLGGHLVVLPGLLIVVTVLCLYIIGDGVRDALDPTIVD
jgi:peptide/nickel transport system permease protein